jgi:hypothetical protein
MSDIHSGNHVDTEATQDLNKGIGQLTLAAGIALYKTISEILEKAFQSNISVEKGEIDSGLTVEQRAFDPGLTVERRESEPLSLGSITVEEGSKYKTIDEVVKENPEVPKPIVDQNNDGIPDDEETPREKKQQEVDDVSWDDEEVTSPKSKKVKQSASETSEQPESKPSTIFGKVDGKFINTLDDKQAKAIADMIAAPPGTKIPGAEMLTIRYKGKIIAQTNEEGIMEMNTIHDKISQKDIQRLQNAIKPAEPDVKTVGLEKAIKEQGKQEKAESEAKSTVAAPVPSAEAVSAAIPDPNKTVIQPIVYVDEVRSANEPAATQPKQTPPVTKKQKGAALDENLGTMATEPEGFDTSPDDIDGQILETVKPPTPAPPKLRVANAADRIQEVISENISSVPGVAALAATLPAAHSSLVAAQVGKFSEENIEGTQSRKIQDRSKDKVARIANWIDANTSENMPTTLVRESGGVATVSLGENGDKTYSLHTVAGKKVFEATQSTQDDKLKVNTYEPTAMKAEAEIIDGDTKTLKEAVMQQAANKPVIASPENLSTVQQFVATKVLPAMEAKEIESYQRENDGIKWNIDKSGDDTVRVQLTDMENENAKPMSFTFDKKSGEIKVVENSEMTPVIASKIAVVEKSLQPQLVQDPSIADKIDAINNDSIESDNNNNDSLEDVVTPAMQEDQGSSEPEKPAIKSDLIAQPAPSQQLVTPIAGTVAASASISLSPSQVGTIAKAKAIVDQMNIAEAGATKKYNGLQMSAKKEGEITKYKMMDSKSFTGLEFSANTKTGEVTEVKRCEVDQIKEKIKGIEDHNKLQDSPEYLTLVESSSKQIAGISLSQATGSKKEPEIAIAQVAPVQAAKKEMVTSGKVVGKRRTIGGPTQ